MSDKTVQSIVPAYNDFVMYFKTNSKESTLTIKNNDVHKLARLLYEMCIDNRINAELKIK